MNLPLDKEKENPEQQLHLQFQEKVEAKILQTKMKTMMKENAASVLIHGRNVFTHGPRRGRPG